MKNIIFLDIDGVLVSQKSSSYDSFAEESIIALKKLIEKYNAKIVIISSWQGRGLSKTRNRVRNIFKEYNIENIDFINPNLEGYIKYSNSINKIKLEDRPLGIIEYLKNNPTANYIILDDEYAKYYKLIQLNHYQTSFFTNGLTIKDIEKIKIKPVNLDNFKYITYDYEKLTQVIKEEITPIVETNLVNVLKKVLIKKENNQNRN